MVLEKSKLPDQQEQTEMTIFYSSGKWIGKDWFGS